MNNSATNTPRTRDKKPVNRAKKRDVSPKEKEISTNTKRVRFAFVPILREFRQHTKKNEARLWIPIETSLLVRYEFASCSLQTRYVFVAILLYCGANGLEEIPLDARFMSSVLVADFRTVEKSFEELLSKNLLQEREKREKRKEQTDRQETLRGVSVDSENLSQNEEEEKEVSKKRTNGHASQFSIEECLRYVEKCQTNGDEIKNSKALATNLFKTGEADSFILATLYPEKQKEIDAQVYGEPVQFTVEPCAVCFGAKMSDADGKGFRSCDNCKNEKGISTGYEPFQKEKNDE